MKSSSKTQELLISSHLILAFTLQIPLARFSSFWHFNRSKACCGSDIFLLSSVQLLSHVRHFVTPWTIARQASLSITNSQSLPKFMSIESAMPSNHLILCCPFSSCLQSFPASGSFQMSQFFASGGQSTGISASAPVLPVNIQDSFRMDWLDLPAVQGILKSLLQHHSSKASVLCSAFFIV